MVGNEYKFIQKMSLMHKYYNIEAIVRKVIWMFNTKIIHQYKNYAMSVFVYWTCTCCATDSILVTVKFILYKYTAQRREHKRYARVAYAQSFAEVLTFRPTTHDLDSNQVWCYGISTVW